VEGSEIWVPFRETKSQFTVEMQDFIYLLFSLYFDLVKNVSGSDLLTA
jgi:hypothetical protein